MKTRLLFSVIISLFVLQGFGQRSFTSLNYSIGFPAGDLKDFAGNTSGRGVTLDYAFYVKNNVSVGLGIGLQTFYEEKGYQSFTNGTQTLSGNMFNYVNALPFYINGAYYFGDSATIKPYIGVGLGTMYVKKRYDIGVFEVDESGWAFLVKPEIGLQYKATSYLGVNASFRYNYATDVDDVGSMSYTSLLIGLVWYH
ncbi:outer membrane beta-barrel protein [Flavobacterium beibuense]|uniref:outer membrane beta-barrel protein n=1 Tax=Flavobacterium beibuense TaxID=657326 RepID=UPI003A916FA3